MSLPLPHLDDRTYADLVTEARALIPGVHKEWTDHNPSDPGITLIELFCWLAEMLLYRIDRVSDSHRQTFLKLLNGPRWKPGLDLEEDVRSTLADLRRRFRAVTVEDYEVLARETPSEQVARARCVPRRDLSTATEAERSEDRPSHLSVIVLEMSSQAESAEIRALGGRLVRAALERRAARESEVEAPPPQPPESLLQAVHGQLDERRLLTARHHVVGPVWAPVGAEILIARRPDAPADAVQIRVVEALQRFLDPLPREPDGLGWPFGRDVYVSELNELLERIPGVDFVSDLELSSTVPAGWPRCEQATALLHDEGDLIGLGLSLHHLPWLHKSQVRIRSGAAFVEVRLEIPVTLAGPAGPSEEAAAGRRTALRAVRQAVREIFHPLHAGPDPEPEIALEQIRTRILELQAEGIQAVGEIKVVTRPDRLSGEGVARTLHLEPGELADVRTTLAVVPVTVKVV